MRRFVVLVVLLAMMLGLATLKTDQVRAHDPMMLAAIGFVILAAFTVSELGSLLKLPRVTGYILTGIALGPSAANILSTDVVGEMKMFNTLALGVIATGAGLELDLGQLRKVYKTLLATVAAKIVIGGALVFATMIGMQAALGSLELSSQAQVFALALVLGALSIGTSPAIVLAVINESKAKGRLSDLMLGAAVLKDLVVVIALAVAVAVAKTLLVPDAALESTVLVNVAREIGSSMAAGAVLGALLVLYVRYVHAEMLLFVAAMILVVSELGMALHLELLLVFITAGFVVRNFSRYEHELADPLSLVSLPVFVVFFTNAGAGVDLLTTWKILPLALALCAARAVGFYVSARVGGVIGREPEGIRRNAWLGYLPQAGVTLGLIGLVSQQLPELGGPIASTGMAVVALNLLVGPVTLRRALRQVGEIAGADFKRSPDAATTPRPSPRPEAPVHEVEREAVDVVQRAESAIEGIEHDELRIMAKRTFDRLRQTADEFIRDELKPWAVGYQERASEAIGGDPTKDGRLREWLSVSPESDLEARGVACRRLYASMQSVIPLLPAQVAVPLERRHRIVLAADSLGIRIRKRWHALARALMFRCRPRRDIPIRLVARVALEPPLSSASAGALGAWCAFEAVMLERLNAYAAGTLPRESVLEALARDAESWNRRVRAGLDAHIGEAAEEFARHLRDVDSVVLPTPRVRYSKVEPKVREAVSRLQQEPAAWADKLRAARAMPLLTAYLSRIDEVTQEAVEEHVLARTTAAVQAMMPPIEAAHEQLGQIRRALEELDESESSVGPLREKCRNAYPHEAELQVERGGSGLRASASVHYVAVSLRELVAELPAQLTVTRLDVTLLEADRARDVATRTVLLRDLATQQMLRSFLPRLDECVSNTSAVLARANAQVLEALDVALAALGPAYSDDAEPRDAEARRRAVRQAEQQLGEVRQRIRSTAESMRESVALCVQVSFETMHEVATGKAIPGLERTDRDTVAARIWRHWMESMTPVAIRTGRIKGILREALQRFRGSQLSREIKLRYEKPVLDPAEIRTYTERWRTRPPVQETYARLFDGAPVREHRRFTANQRALETLLMAEKAWLEGGPSSCLLVGRHGSGRTSILNMCELEMTAPRLARIRRSLTPRNVGLVGALAVELGCRPRMLNLVASLRHTRTLMLIDDLDHWVTADASGFRDLERFLNLVVRTRGDAFWLVTITSETLELLEEAVTVRQAFGNVVSLPALTLGELMTAIEGRHQLSGCTVIYPRGLTSDLFGRIPRFNDRTMFFRTLLSESEGNLARAIDLWLRAVAAQDQGCVTLSPRPTLGAGLPFFAQMDVREVAMLVHVLRFGPMRAAELASGIGVGPDEVERHIAFLKMAGLLTPAEPTRDELRIPLELRTAVLRGLRNLGAWT